jgi:hypothetical protein
MWELTELRSPPVVCPESAALRLMEIAVAAILWNFAN